MNSAKKSKRRGQTMAEFYNPYHFVPVTNKKRSDNLCRKEFEEKKKKFEERKAAHLTHDRYINKITVNGEEKKFYSGRIICHIITRDPIFIGNEANKSVTPHEVSHFELNGNPAIPASSIRGMISSIAEAASNSALRVLEKKYYSYRTEMKESLGAIGMIIEESGKLRLRPIALPSLRNSRIPGEYSQIFTEPLLKVYVNGYREQNKKIEKIPGSFLTKNDLNSYCADKQEFWYIKLAGSCSLNNGVVTCTNPHIRNGFLHGQKALYNPISKTPCDPISEKEYNEIADQNEKDTYTRGILRILGIQNRDDAIPTQKTHEIFIPYPSWMEEYPTFDVQDAVDKFEKLAKERSETSNSDKEDNVNKKLPYSLKGSRRNDDPDPKKDNIEIRDGDLVFFKVSDSDSEKVGEIAISSIWRKSVKGSSYEYFAEISRELLPFNPDRKFITIAEQLFGFTEHIPDEKKIAEDGKKREALSFASRLRFFFGILGENEKDPYMPEITLKILDSPKPPCPSFYFKPNGNIREGDRNFIPKKELSPGKYIPQGRKFYLHGYSQDPDPEPWRTHYERDIGDIKARLDLKSRIKPLRKCLNFYFHIDFDNLSRGELSLLCYALKPNENYRHKIGGSYRELGEKEA